MRFVWWHSCDNETGDLQQHSFWCTLFLSAVFFEGNPRAALSMLSTHRALRPENCCGCSAREEAREVCFLAKVGYELAVTEFADLPTNAQIQRYLRLAEEARKQARSCYPGLPVTFPPDPRTIMLQEFAILHVIVGLSLLLLALVSSIQTMLGNLNSYVVRTA